MEHPDLSQGNLLTDEVNVNLNMLHATMMDRVSGHVDSTDIVAVDDHRRRDGCMELLEQLTKPTCLSHSVRNSTVLSLRTRKRDRSLSFGGPRDDVVAEEDTISGSGAPRVWTACPISIGVGCQASDAACTDVKPGGEDALDVPQDTLEHRKVRLARVVHEETHLPNGIGEVRTSQREVL
jgi:hypothetical protein